MSDRTEPHTSRVVTIRELHQHTSTVLDEINSSGRQALVSRHGRFVAVITPLGEHRLESQVLADDPVLREAVEGELNRADADDAPGTVDEARSALRDGR